MLNVMTSVLPLSNSNESYSGSEILPLLPLANRLQCAYCMHEWYTQYDECMCVDPCSYHCLLKFHVL